MAFPGTLRVFADAAALARGAADLFCDLAQASSGAFVVALSGGSTPKPVYQNLARDPWRGRVPWDRVHWVIGDERFVPETDPQSNLGMIRAALLDHVSVPPGHLHAVPTVGVTPEEAAAAHAAAVERLRRPDGVLFDLNLLGLGEDGHTASLLPGEPVLGVRDRLAATVPHGRDTIRITLTYPALDASRVAAFLVSGAGKNAMLGRILDGGADVPAAAVRPAGELIWLADRAAAGSRVG
ncbi:MAG: 6-phosphogluconolactonase [Proteobacteria bacterium]|nr:6-phosphogluconolactonase [Pseudomonadota bacterium]